MPFDGQAYALLFLPAVLLLFYAAGRRRVLRQGVLLGASVGFYASWNPRFVPVLGALALATWGAARLYGRTGRRGFLRGAIALDLGALALGKYANFVVGSIAALLGRHAPVIPVVAPLGLSFFVFGKVGYLVDLLRGDRRQYGLLPFLEFVTFFPSLIAGPLVRHGEIVDQFGRDPVRGETGENIARGVLLFAIGLAKKVVVADAVAVNADAVFAHAAAGGVPGAAAAWAGAVCYAEQIYFDFSGYSDMAIGAALMFGLRLPVNFDAPYRAASLREFWRRWHMTLSRFLRDYVFIPLGGSRRRFGRVAANLILTMLVGGLWHGAAWTFVAWGGVHGAGLAANHAWARTGWRLPRPVGWAVTLAFVVAAFVLFRAPDFATAGRVLGGMAGMGGAGPVHLRNAAVVVIGAAVATVGPTSQAVALGARLRPRALAWPAGAAVAAVAVLAGGRVPAEFIYFRF